MRRDFSAVFAPLAATVLLAILLVQTRTALRESGAWTRIANPVHAPAPDPYAPLDQLIADAARTAPPAPARDPFALAPVASAAPVTRTTPRVVTPPPPPRPVLTSIVWDNDPRATVRWNGKDISIRVGTLFADFSVAAISRDQVTLERGGERIVLALPRKGE